MCHFWSKSAQTCPFLGQFHEAEFGGLRSILPVKNSQSNECVYNKNWQPGGFQYAHKKVGFFGKGKTVWNRRGPAAVTGNETRGDHCLISNGKVRGIEWSGSQKTLPKMHYQLFADWEAVGFGRPLPDRDGVFLCPVLVLLLQISFLHSVEVT